MSDTWIGIIVFAFFGLQALSWELERPRRRARWEYLMREEARRRGEE